MKLTPSNISIIRRLLVGRSNRPLRSILTKVEPADLAHIFTELSQSETQVLVEALVTNGSCASTLLHLDDHQIEKIFDELEESLLVQVLKQANEEDAAHILDVLDEQKQQYYLDYFDDWHRSQIQKFLDYPEDSAGRLMQSSFFCLPSETTATAAIAKLRTRAQEGSIYYIYCVSGTQILEGVVSLRQIVTCNPDTPLAQLMRRDVLSVEAHQDATQAAALVSKYGWIAIPVTDHDSRLLGIITVDDIVDQIKEQATAEVYAQAGLKEDDRVYTSPFGSVQKRIPWMLVNLCLAALASSVVALFEDTMSILIILASLKNIVAGVAGNTAIQSLTVVTRGIAVGDFRFISFRKAVLKELITGLCIGFITGLGAGLITYIWKSNLMVSVVIVVSMFLNAIVAALFGSLVPMMLARFKLDPATGSGPIVTMTTDIFSFFSFLGIASLALKIFT